MEEQRLSNISILNIENDLLCDIDLEEVVDTFAKIPSLRDNTTELADNNCRRLDL